MPASVIMDTPGQAEHQMDEDDDQFVVEDSTPLALPPEETFTKVEEGMMDEKPEGKVIFRGPVPCRELW